MSAILHILIPATLLSICYQDFKAREVYLLTFVALYILFIPAIITGQISVPFDFIILNSLIVIMAACLFLMYYLIRYKLLSFVKIKNSIGWGDILLLPAFVISFSPFNMLIAFIFSLLLSLAYFLLNNLWRSNEKTIPLAGIQAFALAIIWIANIFGFLNVYVDFFNLY